VRRILIIGIFLSLSACGSPPPTNTSTPAAPAKAIKAPDETAAIRVLGEINKAQADYKQRNRRYALTYDELVESHFLKEEPSKDSLGYEVKLRPAADAGSYTVTATPVSSPARYFFTDKTGVIRADAAAEATASSPAIQ
jgi:hypothetical protein